MSLLNKMLSRLVRHGRLTVIRHDGSTISVGDGDPGYGAVTIRFADRGVTPRILLDPRLGAAEMFMAGRLVIEQGDIMALITLARRNNMWERGGKIDGQGALRQTLKAVMTRLDGINGLSRSRANVAHHYDVGNDTYRLFLDADMQYSCAYWPDENMTLEAAQQAKLRHIAAKLALVPGQRVLDIGCGWGGMALALARFSDVTVLGITLSQEQLLLARERAEADGLADRVQFELIDYRDLARRDAGKFDRIVSVGMFEHVGARNFDTFFRCCANLMTDDGVMLVHTIGRFGSPGSTDAFTRKYIFPGGYIPALSETVAASEKSRLIVTDVETLRRHYALTIHHWYDRTMANADQIIAMQGEVFFRMWTFYLAGAATVFDYGGMGNYQIQFARNRRALPLTRDYIAEAEARLAAD